MALHIDKFRRNMFVEARILDVKSYGPSIKLFSLSCGLKVKPGQFVMLWIPNVGERPFCPTKTKPLEIAVKKRGRFTEHMFKLNIGDYIGVRGPYGKGFTYKGVKKACVVAGGIGVAALIRLAEILTSNGVKIDFVYCVRDRQQLVFMDRISKIANPFVSVDNENPNKKHNCIGLLSNLLATKSYDSVYCCGPERMMIEVFRLCNSYNVASQFSLERKVKCAVGLCGSCAVGDKLLCKDGPVFTAKQLAKLWL